MAEEVKKEDGIILVQIAKSPPIWDRKEGLREIITRYPFTPQIPIGRKDFFLGYLIFIVAGFLFSVALSLFDKWIGGGIIVVLGVIFIPASYIVATWCVKRFIDIRPTINTKIIQIILFVLFLLASVPGYILTFLTNEFKNSIISGSLDENSFLVLKTIGIFVYIIWILLLLFILFLLFKKNRKTRVANGVDYKDKTINRPVLGSERIDPKTFQSIPFWIKYKKVTLLLSVFVGAILVLQFLFGSNFNFLSDQTVFEKKKECQELGNYVYQDFKARYGIDNLDAPEYTYNSGLDTCLTYIQYFPQSGILREGFREVVIDSLTREELTSYYWHPIRDKEESKRSKEAFDSKKQTYFSGGISAVKQTSFRVLYTPK